MNTISNQTCTRCQNCGEWTNYAGDGQHVARMERLDEARTTIARLNRRVQVAESGVTEKLKESAPGSLGRALANAAAEKYMHERDEALAELAKLRERIAVAPVGEVRCRDATWIIRPVKDASLDSVIGKRVRLVVEDGE